jgi:hypothetical protein
VHAALALQVGYPLVTVLVCLVDADNYRRQVESMADFLVKQMKVKEYRWGLAGCLSWGAGDSAVSGSSSSRLAVVKTICHGTAGHYCMLITPWCA